MIDPSWLIAPALLYPIWEAAHPRIREYTLAYSHLPLAWDGLTLLYVSDSHSQHPGRRERNLERLLRGAETDLILLGGDIGLREPGYRAILRAVDGVKARLGRYAAWGNSENHKSIQRDVLRAALEEHGFTLLVNEHRLLDRDGEGIALCAVDDPYSHKADPAAALSGVPDGVFRLLLMHSPEGLLELSAHRADLILSGHTHGGQIRLPGLPALNLHTHTDVDLDRGAFDAASLRRFWPGAPDEARMVVSAGIGTSTAPVRLFCPPEVVRITLKSTPHPAFGHPLPQGKRVPLR